MKLIPSLLYVGCLLPGTAFAQSTVTVTLGPRASGAAIPAEFIGLSFGMKVLLPDKAGAHFFSATNTPLVTLFQNLGIKHLRVGGTTVESPTTLAIPGNTDIDNLFAFVQAAQVKKVIYSLRLLETNAAQHYAETDAAIAKYIWSKYQLDSNRRLMVNPKGYGLKAFDLGSHGNVEPLTISNPDGLNLTAYAVRGPKEQFVTLINKEHGPGAREAKVALVATGNLRQAEVIYLAAPASDVAAKTGVTLGGASINADSPWFGKWTRLPAGQSGQYTVKAPAGAAAIVRISTQ